jgi:squalene synthase HpnC
MPVEHYENFPVASILLPAELRQPVAAIYHFARCADDYADEGDIPAELRLAQLSAFRGQLDAIANGLPTENPIFKALGPVIRHYGLPVQLFYDLLDAFSQDVIKHRYRDFAELSDYCARSANPIGRLMLHLAGEGTALQLEQSDAICTALQLINHWQDVGLDAGKGDDGRIYLPQEDMQRFGVSDCEVRRRVTNTNWRALMKFQVDRARNLMSSGAPLGWSLPGRFGFEIRAIVAGGLCIANKIERCNYDVFNRRPVLERWDWPAIFWATLVRPL